MSPAPRPYIQSPSITGSKGGWRHMSSGPAGTTSTCACRISERPLSSFGRWMPTTIGASECSGENFEPPGWRSIAARSIANRSMAKPRSRKRAEDEILDRMLLAAQRAEADELLRESDLLDEAGLDRGDDVVAKGGIEGHAGAIVRGGPPPHPIARAGTSPAARRTVSSRPWRQRRARGAPPRGHVWRNPSAPCARRDRSRRCGSCRRPRPAPRCDSGS